MEDRYYITTPIYYVNDVPHIGHTCTTVAADIVARYHRLSGKKVFFLTGTDEHGAKVAEAAIQKNQTPQDFCNQVSQTFSNIWPKLNIQYDYFIRTTNPDHEKTVQDVLTEIYKKGDIYKAKYKGLYCVGCEKFVTETDLADGKCPDHPNKKIVEQEEENYFFKLSKYVPLLIKAIEDKNDKNHYLISPESKRSEVLSKLKAGVNDISISRSQVTWGIPVPWDKSQTIYVWIEALFNYYTATKITKREDYWPADLHLVGKEILWFHAVIWEALLLASGLPLPKEVFAHSFYTIDGQKMSKTLGNVISPDDLLKTFGVDGSRYLIASSFPALNDADVGLTRFKEKYNADLANGLGNLVARVAKLCEKAKLPIPRKKYDLFPQVKSALDTCRLDEALREIWLHISTANASINESKPWDLKEDELEKNLEGLVSFIDSLVPNLLPFMPQTTEKIINQFKGPKIKAGPPLFPRIK